MDVLQKINFWGDGSESEWQLRSALELGVINSAKRMNDLQRAIDAAAQEREERRRRAEDATIEQNALLRAQVKALEIANAASARQAKSDRLWKWIMFFVALAGVAVAIVM